MKYPKSLLTNVYWSFGMGDCDDLESFKAELLDYMEENESLLDTWNEVLIESPKVLVQFINYGMDEEDDEEEEEVEVLIEASSNLKTGEFLYRLNNAVSPYLGDSDHCFFEGLILADGSGAIPKYFLNLGS